MADIPILGQTKPQERPLTDEEQALLDQMAENENPDDYKQPVTTAFVVVLSRDGDVSIAHDLNLPIVPDRQATPEDILGAVTNVKVDVETHIAALKVQQVMMATSQALAQQQQEAALRSRLKL